MEFLKLNEIKTTLKQVESHLEKIQTILYTSSENDRIRGMCKQCLEAKYKDSVSWIITWKPPCEKYGKICKDFLENFCDIYVSANGNLSTELDNDEFADLSKEGVI